MSLASKIDGMTGEFKIASILKDHFKTNINIVNKFEFIRFILNDENINVWNMIMKCL